MPKRDMLEDRADQWEVWNADDTDYRPFADRDALVTFLRELRLANDIDGWDVYYRDNAARETGGMAAADLLELYGGKATA